jgi:hypothetical protein
MTKNKQPVSHTIQSTRFSIRKQRNSAIPCWAGAFPESLLRLHGTTATTWNAPEAGRLPDQYLGWRPITRDFGEVPAQTLPRLFGWTLPIYGSSAAQIPVSGKTEGLEDFNRNMFLNVALHVLKKFE